MNRIRRTVQKAPNGHQRVAEILHLHVEGQVIRTTTEHPFYAYGKGCVPAGELQLLGDPSEFNIAGKGVTGKGIYTDLDVVTDIGDSSEDWGEAMASRNRWLLPRYPSMASRCCV